MKKTLTILLVFILSISPIFSLETPPNSSLTLNFTAGLVINLGFSSRNVTSLIYPEESVITEDLEFTYNEENSRFETDTFYIFSQVFSSNITKVEFSGTNLTNSSNGISWSWSNDTSDITYTSGSAAVNVYSNPTNTEFSPTVTSHEMKLVIERMPDNISSWSDTYTGSITLTITADGNGGSSV